MNIRTLSSLAAASLFTLLLSAVAPAPPVRAELARTPLGLDWTAAQLDRTSAVAWGDVDGDGDLDLAMTNNCLGVPSSCGALRLYINEGAALAARPAWSVAVPEHLRAVAWGDVDGDGDLDLAAAGEGAPARLYRNTGRSLAATPAWVAGLAERNTSLAWGDVDNDGDLDLAVASFGQPLRIYANQAGGLSQAPTWSGVDTDSVNSIAWGDVDSDGDLDLATGGWGVNRLYRNSGGLLGSAAAWTSAEADFTNSVAWGDVDNDGDLDLAVGNGTADGQLNRLYENVAGVLSPAPLWSSAEADFTNSVAWGDVDSDGDLDLAAGNGGTRGQPNRLYENVDGALIPAAVWSSAEADLTTSVAWGDVDGDGDLDLAAGNGRMIQASRLYRNDLGTLSPRAALAVAAGDETTSVAWGDVDADGDLDLAVGTYRQPNRLYRNDLGTLSPAPIWSSAETDRTTSVAWGDVDADGDLDLLAGNSFGPLRLYRNSGGMLGPAAVWSSDQADDVTSVAWGDLDGDGDLDLAAANGIGPSRLYRNAGGMLSLDQGWSPLATDSSTSVAWGDVDGDGDLDLAIANSGPAYRSSPSRLYRNNGGALGSSPVWSTPLSEQSAGVAWADVDADGDLDLAVANSGGQPSRLYRNDGGALGSSPVWTSIETWNTSGLAWGDADSDGDLDLALGSFGGQPSRLYRNDAGTLTPDAAWSSASSDSSTGLAWADLEGDGDLDLLVGNGTGNPSRIYLGQRGRPADPAAIPTLRVARPGRGGAASFYATPDVLDEQFLAIRYTLRHPRSRPVARLIVEYSLNGGGRWQLAKAAAGTPVSGLATSPVGVAHSFSWDLFGSGVMGRHDNVQIRMTALPDLRTSVGAAPGPFFSGAFASVSPPFRVRGNQVRVLRDGNAVVGAEVYRLPAGQSIALRPYASLDGRPFHTDSQGYLEGSGEVNLNDRLVATALISATEVYSLYLTSAAPDSSGLVSEEVKQLGVQSLNISPANPLILFNLDLSLEWDARNDERFLTQLRFNLQRASELLYDWTDGQAALGQISIYHDAERWDDAHVRIYATNRLRPNASQGGIVPRPRTDPAVLRPTGPISPAIVYDPGQLRIGAVWNRYGDADGDLGEDWPRTFAHELGHYALFLDDNYLGLDADRRLIPVMGCPGAMSNPYLDNDGEFHPTAGWLPRCAQTLANQNTGRSDWATIMALYNAPTIAFQLREPAAFGANPGPRVLPLAVTRIREVAPPSPSATLAAPIYTLNRSNTAGPVGPAGSIRAILFRRGTSRPDDDRLIDLGGPALDQIVAHGTQPGDRICVYAPAEARLGCVEAIDATTSQIGLVARAGWQPDIQVTPVSSRTLTLDVQAVPAGLQLRARIFPGSGAPTAPISLSPRAGAYQAQVPLAEPALNGYVQLWVEGAQEPLPRREAVIDYALGGSPGPRLARNAPRGQSPGPRLARNAPAISSDGQAVIYGDGLAFDDGEFFTVQSASRIPAPPPGRTPVGQGYWLSASATAPDLSGAALALSYLSRDVPPGEEPGIDMYFWDGRAWASLATTLNAERNEASALLRGPGLYVLMASYKVPLREVGWNLIAYPVPGTRAVAAALAAIDGLYTTVYAYRPAELNRWQVYDVSAPVWVNDLAQLSFGEGYWISVTEAATLYIKGSPPTGPAMNAAVPTPPATYYGVIPPGQAQAARPGLPVEARVGGVLCGTSQTRQYGAAVVYVVEVAAAGAGAPAGCGSLGRPLSVRIGELTMQTSWDNSRVWNLEPRRLYLPLLPR